jgi:hypothetical protein
MLLWRDDFYQAQGGPREVKVARSGERVPAAPGQRNDLRGDCPPGWTQAQLRHGETDEGRIMMEWEVKETKQGTPSAIFKDGDKVIAKVYLSSDKYVLRIVLPEWDNLNNITLNYPYKIIDFKRKV